MSRRIRTTGLQDTSGGNVDTYFDRVVKYIPADIVGAWVAVTGIIKSAQNLPALTVLWVVFVVGLVLTFLWTLRQTSQKDTQPAWLQAVISTVAFGVWVFALGDPFTSLGFYNLAYGSLLLIGFTLAVGLVTPTQR